jgi:hypothetical protein
MPFFSLLAGTGGRKVASLQASYGDREAIEAPEGCFGNGQHGYGFKTDSN